MTRDARSNVRSLLHRGSTAVALAMLAVLAWLIAWSFAWPFEGAADGPLPSWHQPAPQLQFAALVAALYVLLGAQTPRAALTRTWWFATHWLAAVTWWLVYAMTHYTDLPYVAASAAIALLAGALALYVAFSLGGTIAWLYLPQRKANPSSHSPTTSHIGMAAAMAAAWTLAEWLRAHWFTGFPWGELAYTHIDNLRGLAAWTGASGASAVLVFAAAWWALWLRGPRSRLHAAAAALLTLYLLAPSALTPFAPYQGVAPVGSSDVTLVQGNVTQDTKFGSSSLDNTLWYAQRIAQATTPLVVVPETAFVQLPEQLPPDLLPDLHQQLQRQQRTAIIGMPVRVAEGTYWNGVMGLGPQQSTPYVYGKHHLVPFGEFVPTGFQWLTDAMDIPLGGFAPGALDQAPMRVGGQSLAVQICYEDVFGDELAQRLWRTQGVPTAWVNVSNLAWFGDTPAIAHHLIMARWRAAETGRPVIRATNTGATAIINADGDVTQQLPPNTQGQLVGTFTGYAGLTPYVQWAGRWGHTPLWLLSLGVLLGIGLWGARGRRR
jgi:apolipoprotein N-acyltransferase